MVIRIALRLIAVTIVAFPANADAIAATIRTFGLTGTWADDCAKDMSKTRQGFRIIVAERPGDSQSYTTVNVDDGVRTTIRSRVLTAVPLPPRQLRLGMRIFDGDVDGGPLPSPTTNTFEQTFEKLAGNVIQMAGNPPIPLQRCRD